MTATRLTEQFDRTVLINLPTRPDRRRHALSEMQRIGLPLTPGRVEIFDAIRPEDAAGFPSIGARGCFLSHLAVLKQARDNRRDSILVLEDDLAISPDWTHRESDIARELSYTPWDWLYLGHREPLTTPGPHLRPYDKGVVTAHCYAIRRRILDRLIAYLAQILQRPPGHPAGGPMHVDGAFSMFRQQNPDVATFLACPSLVQQASFRSDIAANRWFDRTPAVRSAVAAIRWGKRRLGHREEVYPS